jgi:predicted RNase H-like HicB family nuclease
MEIPVLVEPRESGYRASMQSPLAISADGATEDAAVQALTELVGIRLAAGAKVRSVHLPDPNRIEELGHALTTNPFHADWLEGLEEYRKIHNAVPDAE